ncbi:hypothetical protein [Serratia marcescens]|uniref:hypothetical protein n=1 Tax=Serratia marcescens TaxID=615 RepID=UPI000931C7DE|nr:hypothetical protein [Serratia marcescens]
MNRLIALIIIGVSLAGCKPSEKKVLELSEKEITINLKDPDSAKFRFVRLAKLEGAIDKTTNSIVCGQINSKNGFGAYTGFKRFIVALNITTKGYFSNSVTYRVALSKIFESDLDSEYFDYTKLCGEDR